uniref:DUF2177 family protein n=1 Tax=viral metagenome TaxID=1070528 RepID=A0A6C0B827_9ZZZZ
MIRSLLIVAVAMLLMDTIWLSFQYSYNATIIKNVQKSVMKMRYIPAALVYLIMPLAVTYLAIVPSKSIQESVKKGALVGLAMYGVYDLTNLATLDAWTNRMAMQDIAWGTFLCSVTAGIGYKFK